MALITSHKNAHYQFFLAVLDPFGRGLIVFNLSRGLFPAMFRDKSQAEGTMIMTRREAMLASTGLLSGNEAAHGANWVSESMMELGKAHLRVARPTDQLAEVVKFYRDGLGFTVLYEFTDHDGFDGVMLGHRGAAYHLEFTHKKGHRAGRAPSEDNLLVFYLPDTELWKKAVARMQAAGHQPVKAFNPYWDKKGKTFEDPDGYRIVLQNTSWSV